MSDPWLKFYPSDWRADPALRVCSIAARGLWMEMLCVMHESAPRGSFLVNGRKVTDRQLAGLAGCSMKEAASLLAELEEAGVFSRDEDGTVFSRRMRKDDQKAEKDKANGRSGGNPKLKRGVNPQDKAQKPEARSQTSETSEIDQNSISSRAPTSVKSDGFPQDGSVAYSRWGEIIRAEKRGVDVDHIASAFRSFCREKDIDLSARNIEQRLRGFCKSHKVIGLAA